MWFGGLFFFVSIILLFFDCFFCCFFLLALSFKVLLRNLEVLKEFDNVCWFWDFGVSLLGQCGFEQTLTHQGLFTLRSWLKSRVFAIQKPFVRPCAKF